MRFPSSFVVSLVLTATISFAIPVAIVGLVFGLAIIFSITPGFVGFGQQALNSILEFLATFGTGKPVAGMVTLGLACSFVGILFDLFNTYRYQSLR